MKTSALFFLVMLAFCNSALATTYKLDFILEILDGASITPVAPIKETAITQEGQPATISTGKISVQLIPTKEQEGTVKIKADIWGKSDGVSKLHIGTPTIVTRLNQSAKVSESDDREKPIYSFSVTPSEH